MPNRLLAVSLAALVASLPAAGLAQVPPPPPPPDLNTLPPPPLPPEAVPAPSVGDVAAQARADVDGESAWLFFGIAAGASLVLGLVGCIACWPTTPVCGALGCLGTTGVSYLIPTEPAAARTASLAPTEAKTYAEAYSDQLRFRRAKYAFLGGAAGAAAALLVLGAGVLVLGTLSLSTPGSGK